MAREILSTEKTYVESLALLKAVFEAPLKDAASGKSPILEMEEVKTIFNHLDPIVSYNTMFYERLRAAIEGDNFDTVTTELGPMFSELAFFLKSYSMYINNFSVACKQVEKSAEKKPRFKEFLTTAKNDPRTLSKGIVDFLIMPVQRIPRYSLLLADLLKHTAPEHIDYGALTVALSKINEVAHFINDAKAAQDDFAHVSGLQARLVDTNYNLLRGKRKLIRQEAASLIKIDGLAEPVQEDVTLYMFSDCLVFAAKARKKMHVKHWLWMQELLSLDKEFMSLPPISDLCIHLNGDTDRMRERHKVEEAMAGLVDGEICFVVASLTVDGMTKMRIRISGETVVEDFLNQLGAKCGFVTSDCRLLYKNEPVDMKALLCDLELTVESVLHVLPNSSSLLPSVQPIAKRAELLEENLLVDFGGDDKHGSLHIEVLKDEFRLNPHSAKLEKLQIMFCIPSLGREEAEYFVAQLQERIVFCRDRPVDIWKMMHVSERGRAEGSDSKSTSFLSNVLDSVRDSALAGLVSPTMQRRGSSQGILVEKRHSSASLRRTGDDLNRSNDRMHGPDVETRKVALIPISPDYRDDVCDDPRAILREFAVKAVPKPPVKRSSGVKGNSGPLPVPPAPPKPRAASMIELRSKTAQSISDRINAEIEAAERSAKETASAVSRRIETASLSVDLSYSQPVHEPVRAPVHVPQKPIGVVLAKKGPGAKGKVPGSPNLGRPLVASSVPSSLSGTEAAKTMLCCGEAQNEGKFCTVCGKKFGAVSPLASPMLEPRPRLEPPQPQIPCDPMLKTVKIAAKKFGKKAVGEKWKAQKKEGLSGIAVPPKPQILTSPSLELKDDDAMKVSDKAEISQQRRVAEAVGAVRGGLSLDTLRQLGQLDDEEDEPPDHSVIAKVAFKSAPPPPPGKRR